MHLHLAFPLLHHHFSLHVLYHLHLSSLGFILSIVYFHLLLYIFFPFPTSSLILLSLSHVILVSFYIFLIRHLFRIVLLASSPASCLAFSPLLFNVHTHFNYQLYLSTPIPLLPLVRLPSFNLHIFTFIFNSASASLLLPSSSLSPSS